MRIISPKWSNSRIYEGLRLEFQRFGFVVEDGVNIESKFYMKMKQNRKMEMMRKDIEGFFVWCCRKNRSGEFFC